VLEPVLGFVGLFEGYANLCRKLRMRPAATGGPVI